MRVVTSPEDVMVQPGLLQSFLLHTYYIQNLIRAWLPYLGHVAHPVALPVLLLNLGLGMWKSNLRALLLNQDLEIRAWQPNLGS